MSRRPADEGHFDHGNRLFEGAVFLLVPVFHLLSLFVINWTHATVVHEFTLAAIV